jgi:hypothetical protein
VYFEPDATAWRDVPDDWPGKVEHGEPDVRYKMLTEPRGSVPGIQLVEFEPSHFEEAHSHPEGEVLYVLRGEMAIGDLALKAGSGVVIEKDTIYGPLRAGAGGVAFLRVGLPG